MKNAATFILILFLGVTIQAQTNVELTMTHEFQGQAFSYGQLYTNTDGKVVKFSRVQYYLSGMSFTHDGGQTTPLTDQYVLGSANISNYDLGTHSLTSLEAFNFNLGVDAAANGSGTSNYSAPHPLASQSPSMDWGWPSGYFFIVIDGMVDSNNDGVPNKAFQFHALGNHLLRPVSVNISATDNGGTITMQMYANIADWIQNIDLVSNGIQHNGGSINSEICDNTNDYTVFSASPTVGFSEITNTPNHLFVDYTIAYAPTIYYTFHTNEKLTVIITDSNGKIVLLKDNLISEGNFFINKELPDGFYVATFTDGKSTKESIKFTVNNY
ncbi:MAG: T9SS type A sorting domain-containing protein [Flavobacteriales bacterium]|jgi:hypothetical protein|nr:T9SS type A sorting domain-containing protein [Flavobacteriales bacterium]